MNTIKFRNALLLIVILLIQISIRAQGPPDAIVVKVNGKAFARDTKNGNPKRLNKGDKLFAGQQVRCEKECRELHISYCNITRPVSRSSKWTTILSINCEAMKVPRGGAPKGPTAVIISPREAEVIRPDAFALRWRPSAEPVATTIVLRNHLGIEIWSKKHVPGNLGSLNSDGLKQILKDVQKEGDLNLSILLDQPQNGVSERVAFKLLSREDDLKLANELAPTQDETDEVFRHLSRGLRFVAYQLHSEAVPEVELALAILRREGADADSLDELVKLAIMANYKAYNTERVLQLCAGLKKADSLPECLQRER